MNEDVWKILIIDDSPDDRAEIRRLLLTGSNRCYVFTEADNGAAGLRLCEDVTCVMLDYNLPDLDAIEVLAELRRGREMTCCPVLVLMGSSVREMASGLLRAGAMDYVGKEWAIPESLTRAVENAVERFTLQRELQESKRQLHQAMEAARAGSWKVNLATREFSASDRAIELHGLPPGTPLTHERALACIHPEDRAAVESALQRTVEEDEPFRLELRVPMPDGSIRWVASQAERQNDGYQTCVVGLVQDITERKRAEEFLQRRNKQLDLLARVSQLLILGSHSETELLHAVFSQVARTIGAEMYFNYQPYDDVSMRLNTWEGLTDDEYARFETMRYGELLCGRVAVSRRPLIIEDIAHNAVEGSEAVRAAGYGAYVGVPLVAGERLFGTIAFITRTKTHFAEGEVKTIKTVCDQVAAMLERSRLTRELRESEEQQRLALDGGGLGTWDVDLKTGKAAWNRRQWSLQGYAPDSGPATMEHWRKRVHADDVERVTAEIERAQHARNPVAIEHRLLRADTGELRWLSLFGRFTYDASGEAVRFSGVSRDITERKQVEERLQQQAAILEQMTEAVNVTDENGILLYMNSGFDRHFGYEPGELLGQHVSVLNGYPPEENERKVAEILHSLKVSGEWHGEVLNRRKDGSTFVSWGSVTAQRIGGRIRYVSVQSDITNRMEAEAARDRLMAEEHRLRETAEAATRAKDEFLAVVSHELRSPLNAILGYTRMTRMRPDDVEVIRKNCEVVERNARIQQQLIEDLLDSARIISGKLRLEIAPTDLKKVLEEAIEVVHPAAMVKGVLLSGRLEDAPRSVLCDAARVRQICWNLLQNAIKFTPQGGTVELLVERELHQVRLIICDTGRGIEPQFLPTVFERFSQNDTASARRQGGLGLGLSLVKQLIEMHGGMVEATSPGKGMGSTFTITLPLNAE